MSKKRYYRKKEIVWSKEHKRGGIVKSIDLPNKEMTVLLNLSDGTSADFTGKLWEFDKYRNEFDYRDGVIGFSLFRDSAVVPFKNKEDAGYDVFLDIPQDYTYVDEHGVEQKAWVDGVLNLRLKHLTTNLLPTGVGVKVNRGMYTDWANERGSTGKLGISILSGVVDSGYRDEVFLNVMPLVKDIVITNSYEEVKSTENEYFFPYSKAIAQMIPRPNLGLLSYTIPLDEFKDDKTLRGSNKLGSTDKK